MNYDLPKRSIQTFIKTLICISALILHSCEYEDGNNNFHELFPPEDLQVGIDLAGASPNASILIYAPTTLGYSLSPEGKKVVEQTFYLDGQPITAAADNKIRIVPDVYDNSEHILRLEMKLATETGSIAEAVGVEYYPAVSEYKVKYVNADLGLTIGQRKNANGHLELFWNNPSQPQLNVASYEVYKLSNSEEGVYTQMAAINMADRTYIEDPDYVYGYQAYKIIVNFENNKVDKQEYFYTVVYQNATDGNIRYWNNSETLHIDLRSVSPYKAKYVVKWNGETYIGNSEGVNVKYPIFPYGESAYELYILSSNQEYSEDETYPTIYCNFSYQTLKHWASTQCADVNNNKLYQISDDNELYTFNASTMNFISKRFLPGRYHNPMNIAIAHDGKIAVASKRMTSTDMQNGLRDESYIDIYSDTQFTTLLKTINVSSNPTSFKFISTDKLFVYFDHKASIYNIDTDIYLCELIDNSLTKFDISDDNKYIYGMKGSGIDSFSIFRVAPDSKSIEKIYQSEAFYDNNLKDLWFSKVDSAMVMVNQSNSFKWFDIETSTFSTAREGRFQGIDPFTNNVLYILKGGYAVVLTPDTNRELIRVRIQESESSNMRLVNSFLLSNQYYTDLSPKINR